MNEEGEMESRGETIIQKKAKTEMRRNHLSLGTRDSELELFAEGTERGQNSELF